MFKNPPVLQGDFVFLFESVLYMKKTNINRICILGIMSALSVGLIYLIRFPIFPIIAFMEYDAGDIPIFLCSYLFGPVHGIIIGVLASIIQGLTVSASAGWIGIVMHIFAVVGYTVTSGLIYKRKDNMLNLIVAAVAGVLVMTTFMVGWNIIFTPIFMGVPRSMVIGLLPYIISFNLIKAGVNTVITVVLYKILNQQIFNKFIK